MTDQPIIQPDPFPHLTDEQRRIIDSFEDVISETGGNDPRDLLNDYMRPMPNNLMQTNIVRFTLAVAVSAQVRLLSRLEFGGFLAHKVQGKRSAAERGSSEAAES